MRFEVGKRSLIPYFQCVDNIVTKVSKDFMDLTEFCTEELIGITLQQLAELLRLKHQVEFENITKSFNGFIFTKSLNAVEVKIELSNERMAENTKKFSFTANPCSCIEEKFTFAEQFDTDANTKIALCTFPELILLKANQNYFTMDGYGDSEALKKSSMGKKQIVVDTRVNGGDHWFDIVKQNKPYHAEEFKLETPAGDRFWNVSIVPLTINGKIRFMLQTTLDVTEKVLNKRFIEQQGMIIKQQRDELETIIESISDAIIVFDKNGTITKINQSARSMLDIRAMKQGNVDSLDNIEFYDSDGRLLASNMSPVLSIFEKGSITEYKAYTKHAQTKRWIDINGTTIKDADGGVSTAIICCRDLTEKIKYQEMKLIKSQYELLYKMIDNLDLSILRVSYPDLRIKDMNLKIYNHVCKSRNELVKDISYKLKPLHEVFIKDEADIIQEDIKMMLDRNSSIHISQKTYSYGAEEHYAKILYHPVYGFNNEIIEIAIISIDVTQEVRAKYQMESNLKMQEELFANISHELKTPLNVIFSTTQLFDFYLKHDMISGDTDKVQKGVNIVKQNCYRLTKLISNIVDLSKIEAGFLQLSLTNRNIVSITEDIVQSVADYVMDKGLNIIFDTDVEEKIIACDPDKIERILLNLISNAIKFSDQGKDILINLADKDEYIEISVKDNGIGIDEKSLGSIFERFRQIDKSLIRNTEGSGIGLCLVKSIVDMHGGSIQVASKVGYGSTFTVKLPVRLVEEKHESKVADTDLSKKVEMISIEFSDIYTI